MNSAGLGRNFRKLYLAALISNLGDGVVRAAFPLYAAALTRDPTLVAGITVAARLPWLLFALVSGALADRLDRKRAMVVVNLGRAVLLALLGVATLTGAHNIWLLFVVIFLLGAGETLFDTASAATIPRLVAREDLERANGRLYGAQLVANDFAGPPLGGLLFALAASLPFFLDSVSFLVAALFIQALSGSFVPERENRNATLLADIGEGMRWLLSHRLLLTVGVVVAMLGLGSTAAFAIFVLFAQELLGVGAAGYGTLLTVGALGALLGSFAAGRIGKAFGTGTTLVLSVAGAGATYLGIGLSSSVWVAALLLALNGVTVVVWNVLTVALRQALIPDALRGRVESLYKLLAWGSMPLGALLGGVLGDAFGLRLPFLVVGATFLALALVAAPQLSNRRVERARAIATKSEARLSP